MNATSLQKTALRPLLREFLATCAASRQRSRHWASSAAEMRSEAASQPGRKPLSHKDVDYLDRALRVNQAGELAATLIYTAQLPVLTRAHPRLRPLMRHMRDQETAHLAAFDALLARHRVRPSALRPVWQAAATALGWATAMLGPEAAMACTEAVETEIGGHYNGQVRVLLGMGERGGEEVRGLVEVVKRFRDEELEHLDHAVENDAKKAGGHEVLTSVIRGGCRAAIWIGQRV